MTKRVLMVAHDAGGARALLPVARELMRRGADVTALRSGPATRIFAEEAPEIPGADMADDTTLSALADHVRHPTPDVLLSASGLYNRVEHRMRIAAREAGVPVVALLDSWLNYRERFEREGEEIEHSMPDKICAIDEMTRQGVIAIGMAEDDVIVTGHPDLEAAVRRSRTWTSADRETRRRNVGLHDDALVIAFFSDPFYIGANREFYAGPGALMHADGSPVFGYTTREILPAVMEELEVALAAQNETAHLLVRPHPSESPESIREIIETATTSRLRPQIQQSGSAAEAIQISDVVMGMMTIALLQSALSGTPAISVQIGLNESGEDDPCIGNRLGYVHGVFDRAELRRVCERVARRAWNDLLVAPIEPLPLDGAASRVAGVVLGVSAPLEKSHA
jgi:hypothetical protein